MTTHKAKTARTRQSNKKLGKTLFCDEQLDEEVPKTDGGAEHGILLGGRF